VLGPDIYAVRRGVRVNRESHHDQAKDDVTGLLIKLRQGDKSALDALIPLVYGELRRVASARLRGERAGQSLQTTALVHETYLRFVDLHRLTLENRTHFFAVAARLMRQILVDHARRAHAEKRGGYMTIISVEAEPPVLAPSLVDVLALDQALEELALMDERLCRVVELKFFAGLTIDETAEALDVSCATVERDWAAAKAWLYDRLTPRQS
jgi:RNA polymerase sigma-70 factor (ECF subfamily)